jgi:oxygen-dependent protoporphyrinogen oxidase
VENLLDPVISGIYAGNVHRLHAESIFENLVRAERDHGSVIRGMMKGGGKKEKHEAYAQFGRRKLLSFDGGLETLITAVGNILRPHAHTGAKITELSRAANGYRISYTRNGSKTMLEADTVIGCAPSLAMATLVRTLSPGLSEDLEKIEYAPIMVAALGYRNYRHPLNGFGFLAARNQQLGILGSLWNSSIFPRLSPEGSTSLTVMIGGACFPEIRSWSDEQILDVVRKEVALTLQIHRSADVVKLFRYERGIPQYNVGYPSVVAGIRRHLEDLPGFFLLGNYLGGVGVNDCTKNAFDFVQRM